MRNEVLRANVRSLYDHQKLRIQTGNRICAAFRVKLGLESSEAEEEKPEAQAVLNRLRLEYKRITDGVERITPKIRIDSPLISSYAELRLIEAYDHQMSAEQAHLKAIENELSKAPIWVNWLADVKGIGPLMAGCILAEVDIDLATSISALWAYCGLDVVVCTDEESGEIKEEGRCRKEHHLVPKQYKDRNGKIKDTMGISFNPFLKTKLIGVLGASFLKQTNSPYRQIYLDYKFRLENHPKHQDKTKLHRHNMAVRYMIKEFLADLWTRWRTCSELPVRPRYSEGKLGMVHSGEQRIAV